jgi:hypothetical protein
MKYFIWQGSWGERNHRKWNLKNQQTFN